MGRVTSLLNKAWCTTVRYSPFSISFGTKRNEIEILKDENEFKMILCVDKYFLNFKKKFQSFRTRELATRTVKFCAYSERQKRVDPIEFVSTVVKSEEARSFTGFSVSKHVFGNRAVVPSFIKTDMTGGVQYRAMVRKRGLG